MGYQDHEGFAIVFLILEVQACSKSIKKIFDCEKGRLFDSIFIETQDKLDGLQFFDKVNKDEMLESKGLIVTIMGQVEKGVIKADKKVFFFVDESFDIVDSLIFKIVGVGGVHWEELFGDRSFIGKEEEDSLCMIGEERDETNELFDGLVWQIDLYFRFGLGFIQLDNGNGIEFLWLQGARLHAYALY